MCGGTNQSTKPLAVWPNPLYYTVMVCVADCAESVTSPYMILPYPTQQVMNFCVPSAAAIATLGSNNAVTSSFSGAAQVLSRVMGMHLFDYCALCDCSTRVNVGLMDFSGDLEIAWPVMAVGVGASMVIAMLYVWLLKFVAGGLIWGSIVLVLGGGAAFAYFLVNSGQTALNSVSTSTNMANALLYSGYIMAGLVFIFFCVIVFLRDRIRYLPLLLLHQHNFTCMFQYVLCV
jgi:hypothetical protein